MGREQPPRARGRAFRAPWPEPYAGATPASAGPSHATLGGDLTAPSNPRERGAERHSLEAPVRDEEQPPRARGRAGLRRHRGRDRGATPASAGPRRRRRLLPRSTRSNPRERGAEGTDAPRSITIDEQPPRARGRVRRGGTVHIGIRATPASAGPRPSHRRSERCGRSNPRERGAESAGQPRPTDRQEQPPRARGRVPRRTRPRQRPGATPASAGPSWGSSPSTRSGGSNPRERGAENTSRRFTSRRPEQPPRARGREPTGWPNTAPQGATPASAGPRNSPTSPTSTRRSNPRERGAEGRGAS